MSSTPSPIDPASMDAASRRRITAALSTGGEGGLYAACALLLGVSGAAIAVVSEEGHRGVLCSSNAAAGALEDLQITLGEGPGIDADRLGVPVTDDDLAASGSSRWLAFCAPAVDAGAAAVFAFPLRLGGIQPGTLTFNNHCAGPLSDGKYAAADLAAISLCQVRATRDARLVTEQLQHALQSRIAIEQAKGMLAERGAIAMDEAFSHLRAYARGSQRLLVDVAEGVVSGAVAPDTVISESRISGSGRKGARTR